MDLRDRGVKVAVESQAPIMADVLASSEPSDWRSLDPENTLYMDLASGRIVIELAPAFAPQHVVNVKALAREKVLRRPGDCARTGQLRGAMGGSRR